MQPSTWVLMGISVMYGALFGVLVMDWVWEERLRSYCRGKRFKVNGQLYEVRKALHVVRIGRGP